MEPAVRLIALVSWVIACPLGVLPAAGQEAASRSPAAVIDAGQADADFAWQGEFAGWRHDGCGWIWSGLQVVALGGGRFDGVLLDGGLPGNGWNRVGRQKLNGRLEGTTLALQSAEMRVIVKRYSAVILDTTGREIGHLTRMERFSPTLGAQPPPGAIVLFDVGQASGPTRDSGQPPSLPHLAGAKPAPDGTLLAGVLTRMPVEAFYLHLEFRTPYMPHARGQGRGNSGVYIQQRYEVQILDSFGLEGLDNECGGLYKQARPEVNMCLPPLAWQTYDIWFVPPRFSADGKAKLASAVITVLHNGVPIHWHRQVTAKTGGGKAEGPQPLPINLQDHGNPVTFRNVWLVSLEVSSGEVASSPPAARPLGLRFLRRLRR
jgi:hypothetical protein